MGQLVYLDQQQRPVTDSLLVAETFGKKHDKVLRDIRELECSPEFSLANFGESTYISDRGRTYPKYLITQDGFVFLAMGFTGKEAARFKERYINEFNRMREELSNPPLPQLSEIEILQRTIGVVAEQSKRIAEMEARMAQFEQAATIAPSVEAPPADPPEPEAKSESWRQYVQRLLLGMVRQSGSGNLMYASLKAESYRLLEQRANCNLSIRLGKLRKTLQAKGNGRLKGTTLNRMDVIARDGQLKELYVGIVEEMASGVVAQ